MPTIPATIVQATPERTTPKGRPVRAQFLARINYPALLSGQRCTITVTGDPADALTYTDQEVLDSALELLASLGYDQAVSVRKP